MFSRQYIHWFNLRILNLLLCNSKTPKSLADYLRYEVSAVNEILSGRQSFQFPDLVRICRFFNVLPADFFYDRISDTKFEGDLPGNYHDTSPDTAHSEIVDSFFAQVVYN